MFSVNYIFLLNITYIFAMITCLGFLVTGRVTLYDYSIKYMGLVIISMHLSDPFGYELLITIITEGCLIQDISVLLLPKIRSHIS